MKAIGFDQSTKITGYSVWINKKLIKYGTLEVKNADKFNPWERMREMYWLISDFLDNEKPDIVGFEGVQFQNNYSVYQVLSEMRGVLATALIERDVAFVDIMPTEWKSFCKIQGKKREDQKLNTIQMVKREFNIDVTEDEADSIGLGLCLLSKIRGE
jgi:Holliday junction resolvasome RuvABC endonuclease subunit